MENEDDDFVVVVEGRGKRPGGKGGRGVTDDGERGARCHLCHCCRVRSRFCQPLPPSGEWCCMGMDPTINIVGSPA